MTKLKAVEVLQYNGVNMKVISTKRTMPVVWHPFLGSWIINEFENSGKWGSAPGKQTLRVNTSPVGKVELFQANPYVHANLMVVSSGMGWA